MLRIIFTGDDIARTRVAMSPDPLWELVLSIHMLRGQPGDLLFTQWRRATVTALRRVELHARLRLLSTLTPTLGYFPDFLTPAAAGRGLPEGLAAIRSTPITNLRRDLQRLDVASPAADAVSRLASGDVAMLTDLTDTMREYYEIVVGPHRATIDAAVDRDRGLRMRALLNGGVEALLNSLRPMMTWNSGELRVHAHPDQELRLGGRGLLLVPSYFCINHPMTMFDASLPPVLIYPVQRGSDEMLLAGGRARSGLGSLIGGTRADVLRAVANGACTTTELARAVGVSPASASEHSGTLRAAGLIASRRDRNRVMHEVTPLGLALLNGR